MAEMNMVHAKENELSAAMTFTAGAATMTVGSGKDERTAILIHNTDSTPVGILVKAGDGLRSSIGDLVCTIPAGEMRALPLESMRFKQMNGEAKGKFTLKLCAPGNPGGAYAGTAAKVLFLQLRV